MRRLSVRIYHATDGVALATLGKKIAWMRTNPLVCLEIDERLDHFRWMSVIVLGRYEEIPDTPKDQHARAYALEILQKRTLWWEPACVPTERHDQRPPIFYRIDIEKMTGRRSMPNAVEASLLGTHPK